MRVHASAGLGASRARAVTAGGAAEGRVKGRAAPPDGRHPQPPAPGIEASAVGRVTLHDIRHISATLPMAAGAGPKKVSHDLGRAGVALTLDLYCLTVEEMHERASGKLEGVLFPEKRAGAG